MFSEAGKQKIGLLVDKHRHLPEAKFGHSVLREAFHMLPDPHIPLQGRKHVGFVRLEKMVNTIAKRQKGFHLQGQREAIFKDGVEELFAKGLSEHYWDGPSLNNVFPVAKKSGKCWLVVEYTYLNTQLHHDQHTIPRFVPRMFSFYTNISKIPQIPKEWCMALFNQIPRHGAWWEPLMCAR